MVLLWILFCFINFVKSNVEKLSINDPNYGITWMYIPDDKGNPHFVDLTLPMNDSSQTRAMTDVGEDVTFYFYRQSSTNNQSQMFKMIDDEKPLAISEDFSPELPTKFLIHGWLSSHESDIGQKIKNAYLQREDMNVIVVDWSPLAKDPVYYRSATSTRNVGQQVAKVIDKLISERGTSLDNIHVIGHSLGAHTSGFAGYYTKSGKISRVTGLDPAKPGFTDQQPDKLLDPSDAQFVDIIHTCSGLLGSDLNLGHVDFWPNGGKSSQPGCNGWLEMVGSCSHGRSYEFFAESVNNPDSFMAFPCDNNPDFMAGKCNDNPIAMGDPVPRDARGNYFLTTKEEALYGRGLKFY